EPLDRLQDRGQRGQAGRLNLGDAVTQFRRPGLEATYIDPRVEATVGTLTLANADVADVDAAAHPRANADRLEQLDEARHFQTARILDEQQWPRPLLAQFLVEHEHLADVGAEVRLDHGLVVQHHPARAWLADTCEGEHLVVAVAVANSQMPW